MASRASIVRRAILVAGIAALLVFGWTAIRLWVAWGDINHIAFSPDDVRSALESPDNPNLVSTTATSPYTQVDGSTPISPVEFAAAAHAALDEAMDVYLIIGSDERSEDFASRRADVIMMFILPTDGSTPLLISIPRDLHLPNPCTGESTRVNVNLNGCGDYANGPELVAIAVEDFSGVPIDHFVVFTFEGFRHIVDRVGGVTICPSTAVRDDGVDPVALNLPAGCSVAGGYQALAWVRSRHTQGLINGEWQELATSDLVRNERQQELIIQALGRLAAMGDVTELTALVEQLASNFSVDEGLSLTGAASAAWNLRSVDIASIARPTIPVASAIDDAGRSVLIPQATFESIVTTANPSLAQFFVDAAS